MIKFTFYYSKDSAPLGFNSKGHSGYAQSGADIVCAAVSSVSYMVANTITEVMGIEADITVDDAGEMTLLIPQKDAIKTVDILEGLRLHIEELSAQYPKNVTITITEV